MVLGHAETATCSANPLDEAVGLLECRGWVGVGWGWGSYPVLSFTDSRKGQSAGVNGACQWCQMQADRGVSVVSKAGQALIVASSVTGTLPALRVAKKEIGARLHNGQKKRK